MRSEGPAAPDNPWAQCLAASDSVETCLACGNIHKRYIRLGCHECPDDQMSA
jgi:hypothetical protein